MAEYSGMILTKAGRNLQAQAQLGGELRITKVAIGDGTINANESIEDLSALKNQLMTLGIQDMAVTGDGQSRVRAIVTNDNLVVGFFVREVGVFAKLGDTGTEILYSYTNAGTLADYLPSKGVNVVENVLEVYIVVGNAQNVTVVVDDRVTLATKLDIAEAIAEHDASSTAHSTVINAHDTSTAAHADLLHLRKNSTNYAVGDVTRSPNLPSYAYAECTVAGTTAAIEPTWPAVGNTVTDGTVTWIVKRAGNNIPYSQQIYTTAGTYTFTAPVTGRYKVTVVGGGGGGGGVAIVSGAAYAAGGGGGGGGYAQKHIILSAGSQVTVTVGAGGAGGTGQVNGVNGGTSSFGSHCSATGGGGGYYSPSSSGITDLAIGGYSGVGSNGEINGNGTPGFSASIENMNSATSAAGGAGGASILSGSGLWNISGTTPTASKLGAGGTGGYVGSSGTATGGKGGDGAVIIEW